MAFKSFLLFAPLGWGFGLDSFASAFTSPGVKIPKITASSLVLHVASFHNVETSNDEMTHLQNDNDEDDYGTLLETVTTKKVPPDTVFRSMCTLEKQSYHDVRTQDQDTAARMAADLVGDWSPIFSSGTTTTQERLAGHRVNYFPIKAVISFRSPPQEEPQEGNVTNEIVGGPLQNGLYFGDYHWVRLTGTYYYDTAKRRLRFGYHHMSLFNGAYEMNFKEGQDIEFALLTGLGGKIGLWNILLADQAMMMARGAGRGLTLWKRIHGHKAPALPPLSEQAPYE